MIVKDIVIVATGTLSRHDATESYGNYKSTPYLFGVLASFLTKRY